MTDSLLPCVEIEPPGGTAEHAVIWLHGLGADGHDFVPIVPQLGLPSELAVRFVFPHAPSIPVTLNAGMVMPAWYDIRDTDLRNRHDEEGVRLSASQVEALITREYERGISSRNLILAGFSQGGAIALHVALRHAEPLAGVMALSTYLVCDESLEQERSETNRALPVFQAHGTQDPMVQLQRGQDAKLRLKELGYPVEWHDYPMPHAVCLEEIQDVGKWLTARLSLVA